MKERLPAETLALINSTFRSSAKEWLENVGLVMNVSIGQVIVYVVATPDVFMFTVALHSLYADRYTLLEGVGEMFDGLNVAQSSLVASAMGRNTAERCLHKNYDPNA